MEKFNTQVEDPAFWNDPELAREIMQKRNRLLESMNIYRSMRHELNDTRQLIDLAEAEGEAEVAEDAAANLLEIKIRASKLELETLLHGYLLSSQGDRMSMANSVEGRYPFLGQKFVKDMAKILDSQKTIGIQSKSLFRKTMSNLLPASVTNRPKVAYQAPEAKSFLSSSYKTEESMFLNEVAPALDVLNHQNLKNLNEKISNEFSSDRLGFRENMAYIMSMSAAHLSDISKGWNEK